MEKMNNINKIRRVVDLSKPVRIGNTLYVANAIGESFVDDRQTARKITDLTADELQRLKKFIDEYANYRLKAADETEVAEITAKLNQLCKDELNVEDPNITMMLLTRCMELQSENLPCDKLVEPLSRKTPSTTTPQASFVERNKVMLLLAVIIICLLLRRQ